MWRIALAAIASGLCASHAVAQTGEIGVASIYWQGQSVATGARFNPEGMTAAHRVLPFGALVQVTRLGTKHNVTVKINDRGPFIRGRIIDLSRGAGKALGVSGLARVRVDVVRYGAGRPLESKFQQEAFGHLERLRHAREQYAREQPTANALWRNIEDARLAERTSEAVRHVVGMMEGPISVLISRARALLAM